jgi:two-component system C4-dicarboxylate transport sensor histidine kinase DctB
MIHPPAFALRWLLPAVAALALAMAVMWGAMRWAQTTAHAEAGATATQMARSHAGLLASELQKFRLLPLVLTEYPDARAVLDRDDPAAVARLNDRLELLASRTDAAAIYVIGRNGRTIAASNWRLPTSFVGQDYGFRPYFREALANGAAELFALGTVSGRPGLFIARRIEGGGRALGVIVVKVEFDALEAQWARQPGPSFVTDAHGVVIITSRPEWRFRATRPLDEATRADIRRSIQFGALPLAPLGLSAAQGGVRAPGGDARYRIAQAPVPLVGARLSYLQPLEPAEAAAAANARVAVLSGLILAALAFAWLWRARVRRRALEEASLVLEGQVAARTAELSEANAQLVAESAEREAADRRFRAAREELAQANRLGSIGQITAGVAHEINQPVAAIRTFAENAGRFLDRAEPDQVRGNLTHIVALTDRIGRITGELRTFARRGTPAIGAVALDAVIEGALLLIGDRIRAGRVALDRRGDARVRVVADKVRLEQVLINLIQNALEALADTPDPRIAIIVAPGDQITIDVADNGPGIAPEIADQLFTPFVTGKRDGLGLGLGIARDIVREFGGRLEAVGGPPGGATFRITLKRA